MHAHTYRLLTMFTPSESAHDECIVIYSVSYSEQVEYL